MTDNEIRIAIAEKRGWKWLKILNPECGEECWTLQKEHQESGALSLGTPLEVRWVVAEKPNTTAPIRTNMLPDYPNDLNAMHSAVFELKVGSIDEPDEYEKYCEWVKVITGDDGIDATARQRAEAFCRTLGIWKD